MSHLVKIKFLKNIGHYEEGQEVELPHDQAAALCAPRERHNGTEVIKWQAAATLEDLDKLKQLTVAQGGFTVDEARALGIKNIAVDPKGPGPLLPPAFQHLEESGSETSFSETKSADEGKSAKQSLEHNASIGKKKGHA